MFSQLSSNKLRLHTVTRLFWRNSAICNFTTKSDRQQSTSSIKGYTAFLSSFVLLLSKKRKDRRKETHNLVVIKVIGCCVLLVSVFFSSFSSFFQQETRKEKQKKTPHKQTQLHVANTWLATTSQAAFVLHCSERAYHSFFTFAPRCLWESRQAWKLEIWAEKWTRDGKLSSSSVTDKKIAWVVFSRQTIDTHTNQHYTHHSTRPNKHIKKRKTQREERRMGNRSTNKQRDSMRLSQPTLSSLSSSLPTKNQQTTEKKQPWGVSVLLTACLCPSTFLLAPSQQLGQEATTNRQDGSHGISFLPNSLLLRRLSLLLVLPIGEPPSILCHPKQQPSLKVERQVLPHHQHHFQPTPSLFILLHSSSILLHKPSHSILHTAS